MHELSVAQRMVEVIETVAHDGGAARVLSARVLIGELACIEPETLSFAFDAVARGTLVEGCRLDVVRVRPRLRCRACGGEGAADLLDPCPTCGALGHEVLAGRELRLDSIEVEDPPRGVPDDQHSRGA